MKKYLTEIPYHPAPRSLILIMIMIIPVMLISSCGYRMIGSSKLPFDTINIKHVENMTYEPRLEESLHQALSKEFINQGIHVGDASDVVLEVTVMDFTLGAIGVVDETVKEQELLMKVDIRIIDSGEVIEFKAMQSPIMITFQTTGTVSDTVAYKEAAIYKASSEIAKEIVGRIVLKYAK